MTTSINTIEEATRSAKAAGRKLKTNLTRRNRAGKTPNLREKRLRTHAIQAAERLETTATSLHAKISLLADHKP